MLFAGLGRSVLGKTVASVLSIALGLRPWAILRTSGTVFANTDLPAGKYNIYLLKISEFKIVSRTSRKTNAFNLSLSGQATLLMQHEGQNKRIKIPHLNAQSLRSRIRFHEVELM